MKRTDRERARKAVLDFFQSFSLASNTTRTYQSHWRIFMSICQDYGVDFSQAMTEEDLCLVVAAYAGSHKITTLPQFISALQYFHVRYFRCNLPRGVMFSDMQRGLDNYYANRAVVQRKHALTLNDLLAFAPLLDTRYFEHARDWCACLLAFFGLLRIGEYMDGRLHHRHVQITPHGVIITIAFSKTSNLPATVTIAQRDDRLCPARALAHYLQFFPLLSLPNNPDDPLFVTRTQGAARLAATSRDEFIANVRRLIRAAFPDRDAYAYAGHSFRRGGATAMLLAGVPQDVLRMHGRWSSEAYRAYIEDSVATRLVATRALRRPSP